LGPSRAVNGCTCPKGFDHVQESPDDMDKMIGADFEKGLSQLKVAAESEARAAAGSPAASR